MGVINEYACSNCGYHAEVHEGSGFVIRNELRRCRATNDLVGVTVSVHSTGGRQPPADPPLNRCPDCGSSDVVEPKRIGVRRRVQCPRCGGETRRTDGGRRD